MLVIVVLSAQSDPLPQVTTRVWDKLLHVIEYTALGLLWCRTCRGAGLRWTTATIVAVLATAAFGATDEWHQSFVPRRTADVQDWMADLFGGLLGAGMYAVWMTGVVDAVTRSRTAASARTRG